jgi:DeoR/GlpR family transcriptional regulator of sugar metabolism
VILDTGTTTLEIARQLRNRRKAKIITTSLAIVSELQFAGEIQTILLGGYMREGSPDLHGPLTERNLSEFHADIAFLGADAVTESGVVYTEDPAVANLDKLMSQVSDKTIIVTNSSKFSARAMCRILGGEEYDALITDEFLESAIEEKLKQRGVNIEIVEVESKNTNDRKEGTDDTGN